MAKKRVHEIAKAEGLSSKELLAALTAAGVEAKAAASSVEEDDALKAIAAAKGDGGTTATKTAPKAEAKPKAKPTKAEAALKNAGPQKKAAKPAPKAGGGGSSSIWA